ncbi:asparagine synthase (glutamine-hydrolyzing) [Herbaspirillum sp. alder98]|uniref:asparagine synthase (glutamine-hydrolyzing) n=1 Tax=Herbaspirillum sp. alder98 TaxID=2913096 RepID=UPI001CD8248E|nr:asparagine synthase (glutamine-hydrolyzing) [Herbaspirillum sp. alder98]MCA1324319.1 asparagine synthase (glutamine-hydrolyzing) [Herbaspirillum sp. alder98]
MCGIAGSVFWSGGREQGAQLNAALDAIEARGPDGRGIWQDDLCHLGHLRLAIIDLSDRAAQPMPSNEGRHVIIFNGEIYNFEQIREEIGSTYAWRSHSDTEVILAAYLRWGPECLQKFRGMFAFAIWDRVDQSLFVARDRMGVKPLYFHASENCFAFASRPRAIFKLLPDLSRQFDQQALRLYLESGYIPAPYACHEAIRKLEPGHYLRISANHFEKVCYWSLDKIGTDSTKEHKSESELLDELDKLIDESVQLRMVSNVPVGAFLSGGIDSSLVVAYMKKHATGPVKTFTIGFDDHEFDESQHAQAVADHLATDHVREHLSAQDLLALMPTYLEEYDEPFFDYSAFPVMAVSRLARRHVTVSLSGDGGDEAFGGYHYYKLAQDLSQLQRLPRVLRSVLSGVLKRLPNHKLKLLAGALSSEGNPQTFAFVRSVIKDFKQVMSPEMVSRTRSLEDLFATRAAAFASDLSPAEAAMRLDLSYTLPDDYLQKVDVGSMAFSLEAREPLLDHPILEWAASLPLKWKVRSGINKYLLRELAYRYVPREILDRPKMGFGVPMAAWLRSELREWAENLLAERELMRKVGLDYAQVMQVWQDHQDGRRDAQSCLWSILVLLQFVKKFEAAE